LIDVFNSSTKLPKNEHIDTEMQITAMQKARSEPTIIFIVAMFDIRGVLEFIKKSRIVEPLE
jgi:hypothetical protein